MTDHERRAAFFAAVAAQWRGDPHALDPLALALGVDSMAEPVTAEPVTAPPAVTSKKRNPRKKAK